MYFDSSSVAATDFSYYLILSPASYENPRITLKIPPIAKPLGNDQNERPQNQPVQAEIVTVLTIDNHDSETLQNLDAAK